MSRRTADWAVALVVAMAVAGPGASSASAPPFEFSLELGTKSVASPTDLTFHTHYSDPSDPQAKPPPLRKSVIDAPPGTVFDGHAVPACTASDDQLMASGASACPKASHVGTGTVVVMTGCAGVDPATLDVDLFNSGNGITELFTDRKTGARITVGHAKFTARNEITETPSPNPGCPPSGETSVRQVDFHFDEVTGAHGSFIRTPPTCPASGSWTARASATMADGHTYIATSATPCMRTRRAAHRRRRARHRGHHRVYRNRPR